MLKQSKLYWVTLYNSVSARSVNLDIIEISGKNQENLRNYWGIIYNQYYCSRAIIIPYKESNELKHAMQMSNLLPKDVFYKWF